MPVRLAGVHPAPPSPPRSAVVTAIIGLMLLPLATGCLGVEQRIDPQDIPPTANSTAAEPTAGAPAATADMSQPPSAVAAGDWDDATLGNLTYNLGDTVVTLEDGTFSEKPDPSSATFVTHVQLMPQRVTGDLDGDGAAETVVVLVDTPGGSGAFPYLAVVAERDRMPINVATAALGDRVQIEGLGIAGGLVTVNVKTHGPNDPMCCPSLAATWTYRLEGEELVKEEGE